MFDKEVANGPEEAEPRNEGLYVNIFKGQLI